MLLYGVIDGEEQVFTNVSTTLKPGDVLTYDYDEESVVEGIVITRNGERIYMHASSSQKYGVVLVEGPDSFLPTALWLATLAGYGIEMANEDALSATVVARPC